MAVTSTIVIEELTGQRRAVTLRGPSLPFQGASWGGEQRVSTTWYPGNATEATQHVLGPTEKPSTWNGSWRSTQMIGTPTIFTAGNGAEQAITRAFTLREVLEDFFRLGQRLRVTWTNEIFILERPIERRIVREGRAVDWDFNYERADDIAWMVTFDWTSRGARQQKIAARRTETLELDFQATNDRFDQINKALKQNPIVSKNRDVVNSANTLSLGTLENILDFPADTFRTFARTALLLSNRFKRIGELINKTRTIPIQLANQALDVANNTIAIASQFIDTMSRQPPEANVARVKVAQLNAATEFFNDGVTQAEFLRDAAQRLKTKVQESAESQNTILAVHIVRGLQRVPTVVEGKTVAIVGELLTSLSIRFYNTPDHAASIAKANLLPLNQQVVERGTMLVIPTLDAIKQFTPQGG